MVEIYEYDKLCRYINRFSDNQFTAIIEKLLN